MARQGRNSQRLLRMRSANVTRSASRSFAATPSHDEAARFANELGCERLRPQVLSLMESLAPQPAHKTPRLPTPPGAQVESGTRGPPSPPAGADVASLTPDETCKRDEDRLARLGSNPSGEEALRFAKRTRLREAAAATSASATQSGLRRVRATGARRVRLFLEPVCSPKLRERARRARSLAEGAFRGGGRAVLARPAVRRSAPSGPPAHGKPQRHARVGGLGCARKPDARGASSDAPTANGADPSPADGRRPNSTASERRLIFSDAKRFASAVTCDALKPQAARLLESLKE